MCTADIILNKYVYLYMIKTHIDDVQSSNLENNIAVVIRQKCSYEQCIICYIFMICI